MLTTMPHTYAGFGIIRPTKESAGRCANSPGVAASDWNTSMRPHSTLPQRFIDKVHIHPDTGCHVWTACRNTEGYGQFRVEGKTLGAHRYAYEIVVGPVPAGLVLDHLCRNPSCVNSEHLEPVTTRENLMRGARRGIFPRPHRDTCCRGHVGQFTLRHNGTRVCRPCDAIRQREYQRRRKSSAATEGKEHV